MKNKLTFPLMMLLFMLFRSNTASACNANASFYMIDSGGVYYFYNNSTGSQYYSWDFGDGTSSSLYNASHSYNSNGTRTVILTAYDTANKCQDTATFTFYAMKPCRINAQFKADPVTKMFMFSCGYYGSNYTYSWDFGDGTTSNTKSSYFSHTYPANGYYYPKLIIRDSLNPSCVDSFTDVIEVKDCYVSADFDYDDTLKTVRFHNRSSGATNYYWDFGDSSSSTQYSPVHAYTWSMNRYVTLIAYDTINNNCSDTFQTLLRNWACKVKASITYYKSNLDLMIYNNSTGANKFYWDFGDGVTSNYAYGQLIHSYNTSGTYLFTMIAKDSTLNNCEDTFSVWLNMDTCAVRASFSVTDSMGWQVFRNTTNSATDYTWYFGDGNSSRAENPVHRYAYSGNYYILLVANDSIAGCGDTFMMQRYNPACYAYFQVYRDSSNTYSAIIQNLSTYYTSGVSYVWHFGDGDSSTSFTPVHSYSGNGPYNLCVTVRDTFGCSASYCDSIGFDSSGNLNALQMPFSIRVVDKRIVNQSVDKVSVSGLKLWPNPNNGQLRLQSLEPGNYQIFDFTGRIVNTGEISGTEKSLDLRGVMTGYYFIRFQSESGAVSVMKFMIKD